ncbi:hypothetical protein [Streptomyces microflavus]|uniref:Uncharacterized protein n=1 Tax=Streptomyces microflavus TaxID=1919 RepID=A0A7H8N194_STRMI|nr:hypothetical protein [Streptomyces microflavus]QKW48131.1 hypothetical protein HUT09_36985 [Streptomyces microflavus]
MSAPTVTKTKTAGLRAKVRKLKRAASSAPAPTPTAVPAPAAASAPAGTAPAAAAAPSASAGLRAKLRRTKRAPAAPAAPAAAAKVKEPNPRLRWLLFNGGAAAAGHLAVWSLAGDPMAGVDLMARMTVSVPQLAAAGLTVGAVYGGWRAGGLLKGLPGLFGMAVRPLGALLGGLWGQGTAPLVRDVLDTIEPWGTLLSPLLAAGPLAVACWYGLDRRAAAAHLTWPARWVLRIPLATVVVSSLLYAPGALL